MSETRTYFLVEYTRRDFVRWRSCDAIEDKPTAERKFNEDMTMADLRESGSIEQDADIVLLLSASDDGPETLLQVAKQRGGRTGEITLKLDGPKFRFEAERSQYEYFESRL